MWKIRKGISWFVWVCVVGKNWLYCYELIPENATFVYLWLGHCHCELHAPFQSVLTGWEVLGFQTIASRRLSCPFHAEPLDPLSLSVCLSVDLQLRSFITGAQCGPGLGTSLGCRQSQLAPCQHASTSLAPNVTKWRACQPARDTAYSSNLREEGWEKNRERNEFFHFNGISFFFFFFGLTPSSCLRVGKWNRSWMGCLSVIGVL